MDNAVVVRSALPVPVVAADPENFHEPSGPLGVAIRAHQRDSTIQATPDVVQAARDALARLEGLCAPADTRTVTLWLIDLDGLVAKGSAAQADLTARCIPLVEVCGSLPLGVWVRSTVVGYAAAHKWWPQPAELFAFLKPFATSLARSRASCLAVIAAGEERRRQASVPVEELTLQEHRAMGDRFGREARQAIAEGAKLLAIPGPAASHKPIVRTKTDDLACALMRQERAVRMAEGRL